MTTDELVRILRLHVIDLRAALDAFIFDLQVPEPDPAADESKAKQYLHELETLAGWAYRQGLDVERGCAYRPFFQRGSSIDDILRRYHRTSTATEPIQEAEPDAEPDTSDPPAEPKSWRDHLVASIGKLDAQILTQFALSGIDTAGALADRLRVYGAAWYSMMGLTPEESETIESLFVKYVNEHR